MKREFHEIDELLKEWGYFFRDRRRLERCKSIEHRYRRTSEEGDPDGWGDIEVSKQQYRNFIVLRGLRTHEAIQQLDRKYKWALTYAFCYPSLQRGVVLRLMKKYTGQRLNWKQYEEILDIARMRVAVLVR